MDEQRSHPPAGRSGWWPGFGRLRHAAAQARRWAEHRRPEGQRAGPPGLEVLEERNLLAPVEAAGPLTDLGTLRTVAGFEGTPDEVTPISVIPTDTPANTVVLQLVRAIGGPLADTPLRGYKDLFLKDAGSAWLANQEVHFLITLPVISSTSAGPVGLYHIASVSLEGVLTPAGIDSTHPSDLRFQFAMTFENAEELLQDPNFFILLNQFRQENVAAFQLIPRAAELANTTFFDQLAQPFGTGQNLNYVIVPELNLPTGPDAPGSAGGTAQEPVAVVVPPGAGVFSFVTTTAGPRLIRPNEDSGTVMVFDDSGEEVASGDGSQGLLMSNLDGGKDYFVVERPRPAPRPGVDQPGGVDGEEGRPVAALVPLTTAGGPGVPVVATLQTNFARDEETETEREKPVSRASDLGGPLGWALGAIQQGTAPGAADLPAEGTAPADAGWNVLKALTGTLREMPSPPQSSGVGILSTLIEVGRALALPEGPSAVRPTVPDVLIPDPPVEGADGESAGDDQGVWLLPNAEEGSLPGAGEQQPNHSLPEVGPSNEQGFARIVMAALVGAGVRPWGGTGGRMTAQTGRKPDEPQT